MNCPDCEKPLEHSRKNAVFSLNCAFCGFTVKISASTIDEAYSLIKTKKDYKKKINYSIQKGKNGSKPSPMKTLNEKKDLLIKGGTNYNALPKSLQKILDENTVNLTYYKYLPKNPPTISKETLPFPSKLNEFLQSKGITNLYEFQYESFTKITQGKDVVIVAPTGMGKTESFLLPLLYQIWSSCPHPLMRKGIQAIIIYPTKALAKDQEAKIKQYGSGINVTCATFDGDTPPTKRQKIFQHPPDILITNPDMLHYHLQREPFKSLISTTRFVVIDEIHVAVGSFGSNLFFILKRLCRLTREKVQLIGASATISNAIDFTQQLFDRKVEGIITSEVRKSSTHLLFLYPRGISQYSLTANVARILVYSKHKLLCFQNNHKNSEIINIILKQMEIKSAVHRAGLTQSYRANVEKAFVENKLQALVATPTLELGIDIGDVDAVISSIVNLTSFTQRLGRAGRKGQTSIGVLVLRDDDPISSYYSLYPENYFSDLSSGYVEPKNELVSYYQLLAATMDKELSIAEFPEYENILSKLMSGGLIKLTTNNKYVIHNWKKAMQTLQKYSIRGIGDTVQITNHQQAIIGERSMPIAARELHKGAVYLHGGKYYRSTSFKFDNVLERGEVIVEKMPPSNIKTTAERFALPKILSILHTKKVLGSEVKYCDLEITETITGYQISDIITGELKELNLIDPPIVYTYTTKGFMVTLPKPKESTLFVSKKGEEELYVGTFHAVEHVLIESSSMLTGSGSSEIGGVSMGSSGVIFVYDGAKGGSGLSQLLYDRLEQGFYRSLDILKNCSCKTEDGCPRCTYSYQCGNNNQPLNKKGAIECLMLLQKEEEIEEVENYLDYSPLV